MALRLTRAQRRELQRQEAKRRQQQIQEVSQDAQGLPLSVAELLQREAPSAMDRIPSALRATLTGVPVVSFTAIAKTHSGPLPATEDMAAYAELIPDGANRIMAMAERQQTHRIATETKVIDHQLKESGRGQIFAFVVALVGIFIGAGLLFTDHFITGSLFEGGTLAYLVSLFLLGKRAQSQSLAGKRTEPTQQETTLVKS